jgi:hypothetical protein
LTAPVKAPLVPEQLGLEQRLREGGAVDGDEGAGAPAAAVVQRVRHQLLAGAALAGDQHGRLALRDGVDAVEQAQHGRAAPDDVAARLALRQLGPRPLELALQGQLRGDAIHLQDDLRDVEGLGDVVVGAFLERRDRVRHGAVGGDQDDVGAGRLLPHAAKQGQAVDLGQPDVADHDVEDVGRDEGQRLGAVGGQRDPMSGLAERVTDQHTEVELVVDEQNVQHLCLSCPYQPAANTGCRRGVGLGRPYWLPQDAQSRAFCQARRGSQLETTGHHVVAGGRPRLPPPACAAAISGSRARCRSRRGGR